MPMSDTEDTDNTVSNKHLLPVTTDGTPIKFKDNAAAIPGILDNVGKFWMREGHFQTFLTTGAVPIRGGRLAVDSVHAVLLIEGTVDDSTHLTAGPVPSTAVRLARHSARLVASGGSAYTPPAATAFGPGSQYVKAEHEVKAEDNKLHKSLYHVISGSYMCDSLVENANGSGRALYEALETLGANAEPKEKAVITGTFDRIKTAGIVGELTLASLKAFKTSYTGAKINLVPNTGPSPEAEVEMMNLIAYKSPEVRDMYEVKTTIKPPATMADALLIIEKILSGRTLSEQLNAQNAPLGAMAAQAASDKAAEDARIAALEAKVAALDPRKNGGRRGERGGKKPGGAKPAGAGGAKIEIPRDADGRVTHWIVGMSPCKCGVKQPGDSVAGGHLIRNCLKDPLNGAPAPAAAAIASNTMEAKIAALEARLAALNPEHTGAVVEFAADDTDEAIGSKLAAHFAIIDARVCESVEEESQENVGSSSQSQSQSQSPAGKTSAAYFSSPPYSRTASPETDKECSQNSKSSGVTGVTDNGDGAKRDASGSKPLNGGF